MDTRGAGKRIAVEKNSDPAFADYLKQSEQYKLLDAIEERILGMTLQAGKRQPGEIGPWMTPQAFRARERLICSNLMLVVSIAACYTSQGVPLSDIVQAGNIGLIVATDKYVPGKARFATYAGWWIARECGNYVMSAGSVMRVPRDVATNMRRISRATRRMETDGTTPDADRLADEVALTPAQVKRALKARELQDVVTLDAPIADGDETITLAETIADDSIKSGDITPSQLADTGELYHKMATVLSARERLVIALHYGMGALAGVTMTYQQIGHQLDLSEDTVSKIAVAALAKLRDSYGIVLQDTNVITITASTGIFSALFTDAS